MQILGIESSCDETAASIIEIKPAQVNGKAGKNSKIKVLSDVVSSQIKIHQQYGGVVPEVAARNHIKNIIPVVDEALKKAKAKPDIIAVTAGPGLMSSLLIGAETAKTLAYSWNIPIIGVNHLAGHIYSNWLNASPQFPALALIVSGGHTELVLMKDHFKFKILGQTRDDAVGEAFDKVAKILGLEYPGGPIVAKQAEQGDTKALKMPRPMIHDDNLDFSFSGLKTSVLYQTQKDLPREIKQNSLHKIKNNPTKINANSVRNKIISQGEDFKKRISDYCASFQQAVIDVLIKKTLKATKQHKVKSVLLAGGVAANKELRQQLGEKIKLEFPKINYHIPDLKYTTDNATMIAIAGYYLARPAVGMGGANKYQKPKKIKVDCNLTL